MPNNEQKPGSIDPQAQSFELQINPDLQGFQSITVTAVDESLPYKPATEVEVTLADGTKLATDANTPYATLRDSEGAELSVSAAAAGHVHELHIAGTEPGSLFDVSSIDELLGVVAQHLPEGIAESQDQTSAFSVETGRSMGSEGVAGIGELLQKGLVTEQDVDALAQSKEGISELNFEGSPEDKAAFVEQYNKDNPGSKIQLQLVRGSVIVPTADVPKQPTTELFMVFGPGQNGKTMYTMAPGRYMPQMPDGPQQDEATFKDASDAWLSTVMLVGQ